MEQLLRGQEIPSVEGVGDELFPASFAPICPGTDYDLSRPILFFPVRHHSPACAFHLKRAIGEYQPDRILIEGPDNANSLIPVLTHKDTKAPLALYYSFRDRTGLVSPEKEDYKCYYPFLDCSPELLTLREAMARGIPAEFIDLPYGEILMGTAKGRGVRQKGEKQTYNDDYLLSRNRYFERLCEKTGMRDFEEFWEKYFEIQGLSMDTRQFVQSMLTYCGLSRLNTPKEEMEGDGCLLRERYMACRIAEAAKRGGRLLVVTGGFHTMGLGELLKLSNGQGDSSPGEPIRLHQVDSECQKVYPMAYSMEAADALNGYASGMQSPGFYHLVWKGLEAGGGAEGAYEAAVLHLLAATGKQARRKEEAVSSYDEICAFSMARGLAALRGKREPGLYELRDSVLSSFVKGECSLSTDGALKILEKLAAGSQVGALCADAMRPPLLEDFEERCREFGLKIHSAQEQEATLEIFSKKKHLRMSRFFYRTEFLGCHFAKRIKGADLVKRRDVNRVREIWRYHVSAQVTAALIDASVLGGTLEEAVRGLFKERFWASTGCQAAAELLVQGFLMGLFDEQERMAQHLSQVLASDGDFFSLARGFSQLLMLEELLGLYQVPDGMGLSGVVGLCFQKIIQILPSMGAIAEEQQQECMESLRTLYQTTGKKEYGEFRERLMEALERLLEHPTINPGVEGVALGLLYGYEDRYGETIARTAEGYIRGTPEMLSKSAAFLRGLFFSARDFVFVSREFLTLVDEFLGRLSAEEFLKLLPELRVAFSYFTPIEADRIAGRAAALHGRKKEELVYGRMVSPEEYAYGQALDEWVQKELEEGWL